jgi:hypothetical protein
VDLPVSYKGQRLACYYRADFVCFESVIVELKAVSALTSAHEAQVINCLQATDLEVGLRLNFGAESLQYKRLIRSSSVQSAKSADRPVGQDEWSSCNPNPRPPPEDAARQPPEVVFASFVKRAGTDSRASACESGFSHEPLILARGPPVVASPPCGRRGKSDR